MPEPEPAGVTVRVLEVMVKLAAAVLLPSIKAEQMLPCPPQIVPAPDAQLVKV